MKISKSVKLNNMNQIYFASTRRRIPGTSYTNYTQFFREDVNWSDYAEIFINKFKKNKKVNLYCYGCSDGSEAFSLAMILIEKLGDHAKKFFPIVAADKDTTFLAEAANGTVKVNEDDISQFKRYLGDNYRKFISHDDKFIPIESEMNYCFANAKVNDDVKNSIIFKKGNIIEDISDFKKNNSIIMFRNSFFHLYKPEREKVISTFKSQFDKKSMLILGEYDIIEGLGEELTSLGLVNQGGVKRIFINPK